MSDILHFLTQTAHIEQERQTRASDSDYKADNTRFKLPLKLLQAKGGDMQQFCSFYYQRLNQLKPAVREAAEIKWDCEAEFVDNILDLKPGQLTVIIGTVFKEQP
jgi:hypothetical protein